ncbi:MAG: metalloregulator ArsR/SmtB family transcription factor [Methanobacteriaceae archaeon]|jgi:DNA-binding transcriptional ArsR family regulator|nr:metalloregulator ArsR/SmtB family transcription factor [Methanobacteriaceae archaeon]
MGKNEICEIKNIRKELVDEISKKLEPHSSMHNTSDLFKILSNCTRVRILAALDYEELCVCELSVLLDISQSSISHQLRHLRSSNLVKYRKENKQIFYSLTDDNIIKIIKEGIICANK